MAIKSFAGGKAENRRFARATNRTRDSLYAILGAHQRQQTSFAFIISTIWVAALVMAILGVVSYDANIAVAFLILSYISNITSQLFTFSNNSLRTYNRALG
jgi:hypothetical protein